MATRLEQVVRPFVGQDYTPAKQSVLSLPQLAPFNTFRVRATGGEVKSGYYKLETTFYAVKKHNEKISP